MRLSVASPVSLSLRTAARRLHMRRFALITTSSLSFWRISTPAWSVISPIFHVDVPWLLLSSLTRDISSGSSLCWFPFCWLQQVQLSLNHMLESLPKKNLKALERLLRPSWTSHHNTKGEMGHVRYPEIIGVATTFQEISVVPRRLIARSLLQIQPLYAVQRTRKESARSFCP
jgi:hypothetical protein